MVGFHALQCRDENTATGQIVGLLLGSNGTLDSAASPEAMVHSPPWVLGVGSKVRSSIFASDKARSFAGELQVDQTVWVDCGFHVVCIALLVEGKRQVIGAE